MMNKKRHILMVLESGYPSKGGGGAEFQITTLIKNLPEDTQATIIAPMLDTAPQVKHDTIDNVKIYRISYPKITILGGVIMLLRLLIFLIKKRKHYSAIHAHIANNMAAICCLFGWWMKKPVVVKLTGWLELTHGILSKQPTSWRINFLRWAIKKATYYQATSKEISEKLVEFGFDKEKIQLLPNAVDTNRFTPRKKKSEYRKCFGIDADFIAIYVGRLVPEKSLDTLLASWKLAFNSEQSVHLLIIGEGVLKEQLKQQTQSLKIEHQITFTGAINQVEEYMFCADVGILPSLYEGLSNTLLEFMASSLPVIGSRVSGTEDLVNHGKTGWLFEPKDTKKLASHLQYAQTNKSELNKFGTNGREYIQEYCGVESVISRLFFLYGFDKI